MNAGGEVIIADDKNSSSLMVVQVKWDSDSSTYSGHVKWRYNTKVFTAYYGDFDRLLTGNSLAAF